MRIAGLQKLTLLDYPDHMACIVFTQGCNFNCGYCQNSGLIDFIGEQTIEEDAIFEFLKKRKGILSGVVITGGEPTVQKDLKDFIKKIKELGYEVKLDTNFRYTVTYSPKPNVTKDVIYFIAEKTNGIETPQETEIQSLKWAEKEEALNLVTYDNDKQILINAIKYLEG